jgi:hypothetical protein
MQGASNTRRHDRMAPIERAAALASANLLVIILMLLFDAPNGEPRPWYELVVPVISVIGVGLVSEWPSWPRISISAGLLLFDGLAFDMLFDRPGAFDPKAIAFVALGSVAYPVLLPRLDPPGFLRRWSRMRPWLWPIYYSVSAFLLISPIILAGATYAFFARALADPLEFAVLLLLWLPALAVVYLSTLDR